MGLNGDGVGGELRVGLISEADISGYEGCGSEEERGVKHHGQEAQAPSETKCA